MKTPPGVPARLWLVIRANGERHFLDKEILGGMQAWAKGTDVTVVEYPYGSIVHTPPPKPKKKKPAK